MGSAESIWSSQGVVSSASNAIPNLLCACGMYMVESARGPREGAGRPFPRFLRQNDPGMKELYADVSSAAAEIYALSIALNKFLHLAYITDELGYSFLIPIPLEVDNATAILFSQGAA